MGQQPAEGEGSREEEVEKREELIGNRSEIPISKSEILNKSE
jgi:hypothetical protein